VPNGDDGTGRPNGLELLGVSPVAGGDSGRLDGLLPDGGAVGGLEGCSSCGLLPGEDAPRTNLLNTPPGRGGGGGPSGSGLGGGFALAGRPSPEKSPPCGRWPSNDAGRAEGASPSPGGGAVSALVASLAAALGEMAARLTIGKKKYADLETQMTVLANHAVAYRRRLLELVSADSRAFNAVMAAYKLDANAPNREATIQTALRGAAEVPLDVMRHAVEALKLIRTVAERGNVNAATDAAVGAHMAAAACEGAALNVRINIQLMTDRALAAALTNQMAALLTEARGLSADIIVIAETRAKLR